MNGVAPALFDWLRLGTDEEQMCSEVGVCGKHSLFAPPVRCGHVAHPHLAISMSSKGLGSRQLCCVCASTAGQMELIGQYA